MDSAGDYKKFQQFQGDLLAKYLRAQGMDIQGKKTLDLGCGQGGYAQALLNRGAEVIGADLDPRERLSGIPIVGADAVRLPFREETFDLVVCASLVEHVPDPPALLKEIFRVLRPTGKAYLSFPPFYSFWGGHQFSPFHLLGEKRALIINRYFRRFKHSDWVWDAYPQTPASFSRAYGAWGLFPVTIAGARRWIDRSPFILIDQSTRWSRVNFSRLSFFREWLTWHVQFLLSKP